MAELFAASMVVNFRKINITGNFPDGLGLTMDLDGTCMLSLRTSSNRNSQYMSTDPVTMSAS